MATPEPRCGPTPQFRYASRADWDKLAKAVKSVYTAPTEDAATTRFVEFSEAWGTKYPAIVRLWENSWAEFTPFLAFDAEICKVICSTNAIESVNARIRKAVRARGHFPERAGRPQVRLPGTEVTRPRGHRPTALHDRWKAPLNAFEIAFEIAWPQPAANHQPTADQPLS